jgi:hypothetical protein
MAKAALDRERGRCSERGRGREGGRERERERERKRGREGGREGGRERGRLDRGARTCDALFAERGVEVA